MYRDEPDRYQQQRRVFIGSTESISWDPRSGAAVTHEHLQLGQEEGRLSFCCQDWSRQGEPGDKVEEVLVCIIRWTSSRVFALEEPYQVKACHRPQVLCC